MSDRLGQKARIRGGAGGFVGLDVEKEYGGGDEQEIVGGDAIHFDHIRKDTGGFAGGYVSAFYGVTVADGSACIVTPEAEGDWEVTVDCVFNTEDDPFFAGPTIIVNEGEQFSGAGMSMANWLVPSPGYTAIYEMISWHFTAFGLVAGDAIWILFGSQNVATLNTNTEARFRYLGPAS